MQHSKRALEGVMFMDHRDSPGLSDEFLAEIAKIPGLPALPIGAGKGVFEAPILRCSHCQAEIILNPLRNLALKPREYCPGCGRYICDHCGVNKKLGVKCRPVEQIVDEALENAVRGITLTDLV